MQALKNDAKLKQQNQFKVIVQYKEGVSFYECIAKVIQRVKEK